MRAHIFFLGFFIARPHFSWRFHPVKNNNWSNYCIIIALVRWTSAFCGVSGLVWEDLKATKCNRVPDYSARRAWQKDQFQQHFGVFLPQSTPPFLVDGWKKPFWKIWVTWDYEIPKKKHINTYQYWLVVEPPLWKIWVRQLGWNSKYMDK